MPEKPANIANYEELITFVKDRPGHDLRYALDGSVMEAMGWTPQPVRDRLAKVVEWTLDNDRWLTI